jgi:hypothetical protein
MSISRALAALACTVTTSCQIAARTPLPPDLHSPYTGYASALYRDDRMWLCRPDLAGSPCRGDLTATELGPDGARTIVPFRPAPHPDVDCFYIYPTVDLGVVPGNHTDLADRDAIIDTTRRQAARFGEVCNVYVPLYRQITAGSYAVGGEQRARRLDVAFSDVEDAFLHYLGQYNHGRKIVLIGHSQGAEMVLRLLRARFDRDPVIRDRLLLAIAIGGPVETAPGRATEASLANIPICSAPDQRGCIIGYHAYRAGKPVEHWPWDDPPGQTSACVNPAAPGSTGPHPLSRSYFATHGDNIQHTDGITTPFVLVRDYYTATCVADHGHAYLIVAPSPTADGPVSLDDFTLNTGFGLHPREVELALGDLIDLVRRAAAP